MSFALSVDSYTDLAAKPELYLADKLGRELMCMLIRAVSLHSKRQIA